MTVPEWLACRLPAATAWRSRMDARITLPPTAPIRGSRARLVLPVTRRDHAGAVGAYFEQVEGMSGSARCVQTRLYIGVAPLPDGLANACVVSADVRALARPEVLLDQRLHGSGAQRPLRPCATSPRPQCLEPLAVESSACGLADTWPAMPRASSIP